MMFLKLLIISAYVVLMAAAAGVNRIAKREKGPDTKDCYDYDTILPDGVTLGAKFQNCSIEGHGTARDPEKAQCAINSLGYLDENGDLRFDGIEQAVKQFTNEKYRSEMLALFGRCKEEVGPKEVEKFYLCMVNGQQDICPDDSYYNF